MWLIVSVTDSNVCPGAMTAGVRASSAASPALRRSCAVLAAGRPLLVPSFAAPRAGVGSSSVFGLRTIAR